MTAAPADDPRSAWLSRRSLLLGAVAVAVPIGGVALQQQRQDGGATAPTGNGPDSAAASSGDGRDAAADGPRRTADVTVDLTRVTGRSDVFALGVGCSTYGATPLTSAEQATAERRLDARSVRLPVGWRRGRLSSSATGGPDDLDIRALVDTYRSWGWRVLVVLGGRTTDVDLAPGDAARIVRELGHDSIEYSAPNEPDVAGGLDAQLAVAARIHAEVSRTAPDFRLWGPAWSHYELAALERFATVFGERLAGVDYHHYGMGERSLPTPQVLAQTPTWGREVRAVLAHLRGQGLPAQVSVDEVNLSWRYEDGSPPEHGGWSDPITGRPANRRFFSAVNTVFLASVCGHVLRAGGRVMPYATQDRALGMTVQAEHDGNPDGRAASSPMPAYWGVAAWTGAGAFPHHADRFYAVAHAQDDPMLEVFAVDNEAGGVNIVVIDKHESGTCEVRLRLVGPRSTVVEAYRTDRSRPYDPYVRSRLRQEHQEGALHVTVSAMTVTVLVVER